MTFELLRHLIDDARVLLAAPLRQAIQLEATPDYSRVRLYLLFETSEALVFFADLLKKLSKLEGFPSQLENRNCLVTHRAAPSNHPVAQHAEIVPCRQPFHL